MSVLEEGYAMSPLGLVFVLFHQVPSSRVHLKSALLRRGTMRITCLGFCGVFCHILVFLLVSPGSG